MIKAITATVLISVLVVGMISSCDHEEDTDRRWERPVLRTSPPTTRVRISLTSSQKQAIALEVKDRYDNMFNHCGERATPTGRDRCLNDKIEGACRAEFGFLSDEQDSCEIQMAAYIRKLGGHSWMNS